MKNFLDTVGSAHIGLTTAKITVQERKHAHELVYTSNTMSVHIAVIDVSNGHQHLSMAVLNGLGSSGQHIYPLAPHTGSRPSSAASTHQVHASGMSASAVERCAAARRAVMLLRLLHAGLHALPCRAP